MRKFHAIRVALAGLKGQQREVLKMALLKEPSLIMSAVAVRLKQLKGQPWKPLPNRLGSVTRTQA